MNRRIGLKARFSLVIAGLLTIIFSVIAVVLIETNASSLRTDLFERSKAFAALATKPIGDSFINYQDSGSALIIQQINNFVDLDKNVTNVAVVNLQGKVVFSLKPAALPVTAMAAVSFKPVYIYDKNGAVSRVIYPYIDDSGRHSYGVAYDISSQSIAQAVNWLKLSIFIYSTSGLLLSVALVYFLISRLFLDPIKKISIQVAVIANGYYKERISDNRNDEIGDMAQNVNQMADRLILDLQKMKEVDEIKTEFMMIASHNLRTPLTIINGYIEVAKSQALSEELKGLLDSIEANSQRLGIFAEDMLLISEIEAGESIFKLTPLPVDGLLGTLAGEFKTLANDKGVKFDLDISETRSSVDGSKIHLKNAIWNIMDNALKFTEKGGKITFSMKKVGQQIQISIKDTGAGIAPEELTKLFTKFHRGTSTEVYNYEGTGIGLYISKLIIDRHKGTITVDSVIEKGTTFTITLPVIELETAKDKTLPSTV